VSEKKIPAACDGRDVKANSKKLHAEYTAGAFKSQTVYLIRHFGLTPIRAATVARLHFPEARP
jgi:hypothetical protein